MIHLSVFLSYIIPICIKVFFLAILLLFAFSAIVIPFHFKINKSLLATELVNNYYKLTEDNN